MAGIVAAKRRQRSARVLKRDSQLLESPDTSAEVDVSFAP